MTSPQTVSKMSKLWFCISLCVVFTHASPLTYDILTTWDGQPVEHSPVSFTFDSTTDNTLLITVSSTYYNDPSPPAPANSSYEPIGDYEVAEVFFANARNEYVQIQLGPYGHFQARLFSGERNSVRYHLPLEAAATIEGSTWTGSIAVPTAYLPEQVASFNCYYTHEETPNRHYEAYAPASTVETEPDYHNLVYFANIDLDTVIPGVTSRPMSSLWRDALQGLQTYEILTFWNGDPIDHDPITVILEGNSDELYMNIDAPFFDDPAPPGEPGMAFNGLWNYEVVEAFFLNDVNQYLEVEVGPYGQHLDLLLWTQNDEYNQMRHSLPMVVTTNITGSRWTGRAVIPVDYLPPAVTRFNAYCKHYPDLTERHEESLYPQDASDTYADFHALKYFKPIDFESLMPGQSELAMSQLWTDTISGIFRYEIMTSWDGYHIDHMPTTFTLEQGDGVVVLNVTAPYYDDPAPTEPPGPVPDVDDYEVAEMYFLNEFEEYVEVEVGPHGHYTVALLKGSHNDILEGLTLDYTITQREPGVDGLPGVWSATALVPVDYFPPNVTRMNAYSAYGVEPDRSYEALYPAPTNDPNYPAPNFHALELFNKMDFEFLVEDNTQYSDIWLEALSNSTAPYA